MFHFNESPDLSRKNSNVCLVALVQTVTSTDNDQRQKFWPHVNVDINYLNKEKRNSDESQIQPCLCVMYNFNRKLKALTSCGCSCR